MSTEPVSVEEARDRILRGVEPLAPIDLPLAEAHGCVAAAEVVTEYDIPPFSSAAVDGLAVRAADVFGASDEQQVSLRLVGSVHGGAPPEATVGWGEAVSIVRGAPVPAGADSIAPLGSYELAGDEVRVREAPPPGAHIDPAGQDLKAGSILVPAGRRLTAAEIGLLATAGHGAVLSYPKMRVAVASIGPTLIEPGRPAAFGQLRDANSYALLAALRDAGAVPYRVPIVREPETQLRETILSNVVRADAFVASGAPDDGNGDGLGLLLAGLGDVAAYRVAMHPGGTVGFGIVEGDPFFSLPGDPLAAFVTFEVFVRPAMLRMMGRRDLARPEVSAVLDSPISGPAGVALFVPARVGRREGAWHAVPSGSPEPHGLGAVASANGLVVVPPGDRGLAIGDRVGVQVFRPLER